MSVATVLQYLDQQQSRHLAELMEFLRFPTISTESSHREDLQQAAHWLCARLKQAGLQAAVSPTDGHPVVIGRSEPKADRPTVLVYGHYDVQPVDPLPLWRRPPFEPAIEAGYLYARGASDDKGQFFLHVIAAEGWLKAAGELPVNLVLLCEGEEEIGSPHLPEWIAAHREELAAQVAVVSDTPMLGPDLPAICYGLRGLLTATLTVWGPKHDLHSGVFGGAVANPAHVLAEILASFHDSSGRVAVEGFYDQVLLPTPEERSRIAHLPYAEERFLAEAGVKEGFGEPGYSSLERAWVRPTLEVNGIASGFQGEGYKTVIPARAEAKLSCRLVPEQTPEAVFSALERHVARFARPGISVQLARGEGAPPSLLPVDHPVVSAAQRAVQAVWGQAANLIRMGGSIPIVDTFTRVLGVPTLLLGFGLPDDQFHAPNERFALDNLWRGAKTAAALLAELGQAGVEANPG